MGFSNWSDAAYDSRQNQRKATNQTAFTYDQHVRATGVVQVHDQMNPHGVTWRESRDSVAFMSLVRGWRSLAVCALEVTAGLPASNSRSSCDPGNGS